MKPLLWFALMVMAPLSEEILFRGFVFKGLQNSRVGAIGAILIANIVWSAMHAQYDAYGIAQVFIAGLLLGAARLKTNSIYVPIAMHSFMNLIATVEIVLL
jgi:membrane protease YdiL (CAAX protease family)